MIDASNLTIISFKTYMKSGSKYLFAQ